MARRRAWTLLVIGVLAVAGCTTGGPSKDATDTAEANACLTEVDGSGDLEVTKSKLTVLNPDAPTDFEVTFAVEVTNRSKTETAVMAGVMVEAVDSTGSNVGNATALGRVEFLAPGETEYYASAFFTTFTDRPSDLKVSLPRPLLDDDWSNPVTYWAEEETVNKSEGLTTSGVDLGDDGGLRFEVDNNSQEHFREVEVLILLRDAKGNLIGGQESISAAVSEQYNDKFDWQDIDVPTGRNEVTMDPFPFGLPSAVDPSKTEVQLRIPYDFTQLDADCTFDFSKE